MLYTIYLESLTCLLRPLHYKKCYRKAKVQIYNTRIK